MNLLAHARAGARFAEPNLRMPYANYALSSLNSFAFSGTFKSLHTSAALARPKILDGTVPNGLKKPMILAAHIPISVPSKPDALASQPQTTNSESLSRAPLNRSENGDHGSKSKARKESAKARAAAGACNNLNIVSPEASSRPYTQDASGLDTTLLFPDVWEFLAGDPISDLRRHQGIIYIFDSKRGVKEPEGVERVVLRDGKLVWE
jgi:hypothetical protein